MIDKPKEKEKFSDWWRHGQKSSSGVTRYSKRGWRYDRKLTAMMIDDMRFNPILAAKVLLGIKIPPHQELRMMKMWTTYFTCDDSGFSTGKSHTAAVLAALRSILFPDRVSGILSKTFAQGQLIFRNLDKWYDTSPIFASCIRHVGGKARLVHGTSAWVAHFKGGSEIRVLPPNFLQDAERIRSERWHDGYFDEWTTYGNFGAFTTTIFGRVTNINDFKYCPVRQNHIHLMSTPGFKHDAAYNIVKMVDNNINSGNQDYGHYTFNYRHIPNNKSWHGFVNRKVIFTMQTTNPIGVVKSEVDGLWQDDSLSYYSSKIVDSEDVRCVPGPMLKRASSDSSLYIAAFDSARGGSESSTGTGDDFALSILRLPAVEGNVNWDTVKPKHVATIRKHQITAPQMAGIIHEFNQAFAFSAIMYDPSGGGLFVKDELKSDKVFIRGVERTVTPLVEPNDNTAPYGDPILFPFRRGFVYIDLALGKMQSDSVLVNMMHRWFRGALEQGIIELSTKWPGWDSEGPTWDLSQMRSWLNRHAGEIEDRDYIHAEMDMAIRQIILVDVARDDNYTPKKDKFGMLKFLSKEKKDSAYSVIYGYFLFKLLQTMQAKGFSLDSFLRLPGDDYAVKRHESSSVASFISGPI